MEIHVSCDYVSIPIRLCVNRFLCKFTTMFWCKYVSLEICFNDVNFLGFQNLFYFLETSNVSNCFLAFGWMNIMFQGIT
jgi:hypothetical protein